MLHYGTILFFIVPLLWIQQSLNNHRYNEHCLVYVIRFEIGNYISVASRSENRQFYSKLHFQFVKKNCRNQIMLPYYKFDSIKPFYGVPHTLEYRNGYRVATAPKQHIQCDHVPELNRAVFVIHSFQFTLFYFIFVDIIFDI